jgi:hypothetical protein
VHQAAQAPHDEALNGSSVVHQYDKLLIIMVIVPWHAACSSLDERELGTAQVHRQRTDLNVASLQEMDG